MTVVEHLKEAGRYAISESERVQGLHVLLVIYDDAGVAVSARIAGRTVDRYVPWCHVELAKFNAVKNAIDNAIEGLLCQKSSSRAHRKS